MIAYTMLMIYQVKGAFYIHTYIRHATLDVMIAFIIGIGIDIVLGITIDGNW